MIDFRWNEWNWDHATQHGVTPDEAEDVVVNMRPPYPEDVGNGKLRVVGRGAGGRWVQVVYVLDEDNTVFIIHARPIVKNAEKRRFRRRNRKK